MKKFLTKLAVGLTVLSTVNVDAEVCTITLVTKGASADGSVFVSHSNAALAQTLTLSSCPPKIIRKAIFEPFTRLPPLLAKCPPLSIAL